MGGGGGVVVGVVGSALPAGTLDTLVPADIALTCPPHTNTSPNSTSVSDAVSPVEEEKPNEAGVVDAGVAGRIRRQMVSAPTVVWYVCPLNCGRRGAAVGGTAARRKPSTPSPWSSRWRRACRSPTRVRRCRAAAPCGRRTRWTPQTAPPQRTTAPPPPPLSLASAWWVEEGGGRGMRFYGAAPFEGGAAWTGAWTPQSRGRGAEVRRARAHGR
jgi:hypothetical protein